MIWMEAGGSQILFWGGAVLMAAAAVLAVVWAVVVCVTGRKLKKKLEQEYGKLE